MNDCIKSSKRAWRLASEQRAGRGAALLMALALSGGCGGGTPAAQTAPAVDDLLGEPSPSKPKASPLVKQGESLLAKGDVEGARDKFSQAIEADSGDARAHLGLGLALESLGNVVEAEKAYANAVSADASLAEAHNNLGLLLRDSGRDAEGLAALRRATEADPNLASAQGNLAMALEDAGDIPAAGAAYKRALAIDSKQTMVRINYGLMLIAAGDQAAGKRELNAALRSAAGDRAALLAIGNGLRRAGQAASAVDALRGAIAADDGKPSPALLAELALAQHSSGDSGGAIASLQQAIGLDPRYATAHYLLGGIAATQKDFATAEKAFQAYLKLEPGGAMADKARAKLKAVSAAKE